MESKRKPLTIEFPDTNLPILKRAIPSSTPVKSLLEKESISQDFEFYDSAGCKLNIESTIEECYLDDDRIIAKTFNAALLAKEIDLFYEYNGKSGQIAIKNPEIKIEDFKAILREKLGIEDEFSIIVDGLKLDDKTLLSSDLRYEDKIYEIKLNKPIKLNEPEKEIIAKQSNPKKKQDSFMESNKASQRDSEPFMMLQPDKPIKKDVQKKMIPKETYSYDMDYLMDMLSEKMIIKLQNRYAPQTSQMNYNRAIVSNNLVIPSNNVRRSGSYCWYCGGPPGHDYRLCGMGIKAKW